MQPECFAEDQLRQYAMGMLDDESSDQIEQHIAACETCDSAISTLDGSGDSLVRSLRLTPKDENPPSWVERLANDSEPDSFASESDVLEPKPTDPLVIGDYRLTRVLGRGGMSVVFGAKHQRLGTEVAFKVLKQPASAGRKAIDRFCREMTSIGSLSHPAIVRATDAGEQNGVHYLVMERIDGIDLSRLLYHAGPLPIAAACRIVRDIADALVHAHASGIVHRDIKPSNVMLDRTGRVKLLDFGLARLTSSPSEVTQQTTVGQLLGTLDYMAPEQANGESVDGRADVYSLGATLFRLIAGQPPHGRSAETPLLEFVRRMGTQEAPLISELRTDVPEPLVEVIQRSLAADPANRIESAEQLRSELEQFATDTELSGLLAEYPNAEPVDPPSLNTELFGVIAEVFPQRAVHLPTTTTAPDSKPKRRWWLTLIPILLAPLIYFGVTILLKTPDGGIVRIESQVDDVQLELVDEKDAVTKLQVTQSGRETQINVGRYRVRIAGDADGIQVSPQEIVVQKNKTTIAKVTTQQASADTAIRSYVGEGADETGWSSVDSSGSDWWSGATIPDPKTSEPLSRDYGLGQQLFQLRVRLAAASEQFGANHPKVKTLERQIRVLAATLDNSTPKRREYVVNGSFEDAMRVIRSLVPGSVITQDTSSRTVLVEATRFQHEEIRDLLAEIDVPTDKVTPNQPQPILKDATAVAASKALELRMQLDAARRQHGPSHPKVKELESQLAIAKIAAAGIPTEPVYKGKPLRHWEAILKHETLRDGKRNAISAIVELLPNAPANRRLELLVRCLDADPNAERFSLGGNRTSTQEAMGHFLAKAESKAELIVELRGFLNQDELRDGAVTALACLGPAVKTSRWRPLVDVAFAVRDETPVAIQILQTIIQPPARASEYAEELGQRLTGADASDLFECCRRYKILPNASLVGLASRAFPTVSTKSLMELLPVGDTTSWNESETKIASTALRPILKSAHENKANSEMRALFGAVEQRQVPKQLQPEFVVLFEEYIDAARLAYESSQESVLDGWAVPMASRSVVLLTGRLPKNLALNGRAKRLVEERVNIATRARNSGQFGRSLLLYPIEAYRFASLADPCVALAIMSDSNLAPSVREAYKYLLNYSVRDRVVTNVAAQSLYRRKWTHGMRESLTNSCELFPAVRKLLYDWFETDDIQASMVLASLGAIPEHSKYLLQKARTPASITQYDRATSALNQMLSTKLRGDESKPTESELRLENEVKSLLSSSEDLPYEYFAANALATNSKFQKLVVPQAVRFLNHATEYQQFCTDTVKAEVSIRKKELSDTLSQFSTAIGGGANGFSEEDQSSEAMWRFGDSVMQALQILADVSDRSAEVQSVARKLKTKIDEGEITMLSDKSQQGLSWYQRPSDVSDALPAKPPSPKDVVLQSIARILEPKGKAE